MSRTEAGPSRTAQTAAAAVGMLVGVVVALLTSDVILGVIAGASLIAVSVGLMRLWYGGTTHARHP